MGKKQILVCIDWFLPAYKAGGPIQSVSNMVSHLKNDFEIWIITSDSDLTGKLALDVKKNKWHNVDGYHIIYVDNLFKLLLTYVSILKKIDTVYFNSMFSVKFFIIPLIISLGSNLKRVISPRGMLGEKSLGYKNFKKSIFLELFKTLNFHKKLSWHATDSYEKIRINKVFGNKINVNQVGNLSKKSFEKFKSRKKIKNKLSLFVVCRISPIKNLDLTIKALKEVNPNLDIDFSIIGPIDDENYWNTCKKNINQISKKIHTEYLGPIPNHQLSEILCDQHVMILPTQHENFGHVIMESWQMGCPVIISKNTPWKDLESKQLGFDLDNNNLESYIKAIHHFAKMNQLEFDKWSKASYDFGKAFSQDKVLINKTKELFL